MGQDRILNMKHAAVPSEGVLTFYEFRQIEHHPGLKDEMRDWRKWKFDNPKDSRLNIETLKKWVKQYLTRRELETHL